MHIIDIRADMVLLKNRYLHVDLMFCLFDS